MIIYRMVIVEGCCDQLMSSSLHTYIIISWHKSIVSSDWSDTMVWFGQILLLLSFYHPIYMIIGRDGTWAILMKNVCSFVNVTPGSCSSFLKLLSDSLSVTISRDSTSHMFSSNVKSPSTPISKCFPRNNICLLWLELYCFLRHSDFFSYLNIQADVC